MSRFPRFRGLVVLIETDGRKERDGRDVFQIFIRVKHGYQGNALAVCFR